MHHNVSAPSERWPCIIFRQRIHFRVNDVRRILFVVSDFALMVRNDFDDALAQLFVNLGPNVHDGQTKAFRLNQCRLNFDEQLRIRVFVFARLCFRHIEFKLSPALVGFVTIHIREYGTQAAPFFEIQEATHRQPCRLWISGILAQSRLLVLHKLDEQLGQRFLCRRIRLHILKSNENRKE